MGRLHTHDEHGIPVRIPRDIRDMDALALRLLAADQREEITHLRRVIRAPWWVHALSALYGTLDRLREHLASLAEHRRARLR